MLWHIEHWRPVWWGSWGGAYMSCEWHALLSTTDRFGSIFKWYIMTCVSWIFIYHWSDCINCPDKIYLWSLKLKCYEIMLRIEIQKWVQNMQLFSLKGSVSLMHLKKKKKVELPTTVVSDVVRVCISTLQTNLTYLLHWNRKWIYWHG